MFNKLSLYRERAREYGYLYNLKAVRDTGGHALAPIGWRVPFFSDIEALQGMIVNAKELKDQGYWEPYSNIDGGIDIHAFRGVPSGMRTDKGVFQDADCYMPFWTSSQYYWCGLLSYASNDLILHQTSNGQPGFAVRLIKENSVMPDGNQVSDFEGNVYPVTQIVDGNTTQIWTAINWRSRRTRDGTNLQYVLNDWSWEATSQPAFCVYNNLEQNF